MTQPNAGSLPSLATCSWKDFRRVKGLGVRISLGVPRWIHLPNPAYSPYERWPYIAELAPDRAWLKAPREIYEPAFLAKLDAHAADIFRKLAWFTPDKLAKEGGQLVLCCFEKNPVHDPADWCHRRMFADWYQQRTGNEVPEIGGAQ